MQPFIPYETITIAANDVSSWQSFRLPASGMSEHIVMVVNEGNAVAFVTGFTLANGVVPATLPNPTSITSIPVPPNYPIFLVKNQGSPTDAFSAITRSGTAQINFTSGNFKY